MLAVTIVPAAATASAATTAPSGKGAPTITTATSPTISREAFGEVDGITVDRYTLSSGRGLRVAILTYGGILQSVSAPDRAGQDADVVLGFPTLADYVSHNSPSAGGGVYFGALIGRYANRIAGGTFTLDGTIYHVAVNDNGNSLHGGTVGFDKAVWAATEVPGPDGVGLKLTHVSANGEQGYPGTLTTTATYTLDDRNRLALRFEATTDAPTVVNLTNHTYWNLAGESSGDVYDQTLRINADRYTPTDSTQIPTGQVLPVRGTPMDFTHATAIGERIDADDPQLLADRGYNVNWVLNPMPGGGPKPAARAADPASGRTLTVHTTQPGIQFYSGNFLTGALVGTGGRAYRQSCGFALETQHFPDSPNEPLFPTTVLRPGQHYRQTTVYQLGLA